MNSPPENEGAGVGKTSAPRKHHRETIAQWNNGALLGQASANRIAAERGITAQALKDADHLQEVIAAGVFADLLEDPYSRRVFKAIEEGVNLREQDEVIKAGLIGPDYVELTLDNIEVVAAFAANLATVLDNQRDELRRAECVISLKGTRPGKDALLEKLESRRLKASSPPAEPVTRIFLSGKPIATPGNLVTLIAKSKTGKTASVGGIIAAPVAAALGKVDVDALGFTASNPEGKAVVLIDTEQSGFDAFSCYMRALNRAGTDTDMPWLHPYGLAGWSASQLRAVLRPAIQKAAKLNGGVFAIVLDGVADFVADVNDAEESNAFVAELHGLAIEFDCSVICVIHSNEAKMSGDDGRGHLGKQLTRKAESNLLLKKVGDVTTITSEKQRKAPITEADGVAFKWSDSDGRHVSCASPRNAKTMELMNLAADAFGEKSTLTWTELQANIMKVRDIAKKTAEAKIQKMSGRVIRCGLFGRYERIP